MGGTVMEWSPFTIGLVAATGALLLVCLVAYLVLRTRKRHAVRPARTRPPGVAMAPGPPHRQAWQAKVRAADGRRAAGAPGSDADADEWAVRDPAEPAKARGHGSRFSVADDDNADPRPSPPPYPGPPVQSRRGTVTLSQPLVLPPPGLTAVDPVEQLPPTPHMRHGSRRSSDDLDALGDTFRVAAAALPGEPIEPPPPAAPVSGRRVSLRDLGAMDDDPEGTHLDARAHQARLNRRAWDQFLTLTTATGEPVDPKGVHV